LIYFSSADWDDWDWGMQDWDMPDPWAWGIWNHHFNKKMNNFWMPNPFLSNWFMDDFMD
jgi:hypothetical protein